MKALLLLASLQVWAAEPAVEDTEPRRTVDLELNGYLAPQFHAVYRPLGTPQDRTQVGMEESRAGFIFQGDPIPKWRYTVHLVVGADAFSAVTDVAVVDADQDGTVDTTTTTGQDAIGSILEEASIAWQPFEALDLRVGRMRIPFTAQAQSAATSLLFPDRASATAVFLQATDLGGLAEFQLANQLLKASVGLFNGTGLAAGASDQVGVLYVARLDLQPLGPFDFAESDRNQGPLRMGLGAGLVFHPYTSYDSAGYPVVNVYDLRGSVSARVAVQGVYLSAEGLWRYQQDTLSSRPVSAWGGYCQAGWATPLGVEPLARIGRVVEDASFDPRTTIWSEGGVNLFPDRLGVDPDAVRVTLAYVGEYRITEQESSHGLLAQVQLQW